MVIEACSPFTSNLDFVLFVVTSSFVGHHGFLIPRYVLTQLHDVSFSHALTPPDASSH